MFKMLNFVNDLAQVGEVTYKAYCNILAVNYNPLEGRENN